jgi:hypothetical protein
LLASQTLRWEGNVCCVMEWHGGAGGFIAGGDGRGEM